MSAYCVLSINITFFKQKSQYASKEKKMRFFTSGNVTMNIFTEKMAYQLGKF